MEQQALLACLVLCASFTICFPKPQQPPAESGRWPPFPPYDDVTSEDDKIHIPQQCNDVSAVKVCEKLKEAAETLKLKSEEVTQAAIDAVKNSKSKTDEIYKHVTETLKNKVLSKKCEDIVSSDTCAKLESIGGYLKLGKDRIKDLILLAVINGNRKAADIIDHVVEYYKTEIKSKTCEDFLPKRQCDKIKDVATSLKLKTEQWEEALSQAIIEAKANVTDIVSTTFNKFKKLAKDMQCEDLLNPNVCSSLRRYANATKIAFPKIMNTAISAIIKGYKLGSGLLKAIYAVTDYFYDCEDIFDQSSCDRLKSFASTLGVKFEKVNEIIRKYIHRGKLIGTSSYTNIMKYLKDKVFCKINIFCSDDEDVKVKRSAPYGNMQSILTKIKNEIASSIPHLQEKLNQLIQIAMVKAKGMSEKLRELLRNVINHGSDKYIQLKSFLEHNTRKKRDIMESLREAYNKATGTMKDIVYKFLTMSKQHLMEIKNVVMNVVNKILGHYTKETKEIEEINNIGLESEKQINLLHKKSEDETENLFNDNSNIYLISKRSLQNSEPVIELSSKIMEKVDNLINIEEYKKMLENISSQLMSKLNEML